MLIKKFVFRVLPGYFSVTKPPEAFYIVVYKPFSNPSCQKVRKGTTFL